MKFGKKGIFEILIVLLFVFISLISIVLVFLFFGFKKKSSWKNETNTFLLTNLNPVTNETSYGFVKITRELANEDYLSYSEEGSTVIISHFSDKEYECTGSCYCNEESFRRYATSTINRGLFFILSALSLTMAYNVAKETFQNSCEDTLVGLCAEENVKSEIEKCEERELDDMDINSSPYYQDNLKKRTYVCSGNCVDNKDSLMWKNTKEGYDYRVGIKVSEIREYFNTECKKFETDGVIDLIIPQQEVKIPKLANTRAKRLFIERVLNTFCNQQTKIEVFNSKAYEHIELSRKKNNIAFKRMHEDRIPLCSAFTANNDFENVFCKLMFQEDVSRNEDLVID